MKIKFIFGLLLGTIFILLGCSNQSQVTNSSISGKPSSSEELSENTQGHGIIPRHGYELKEVTPGEEYNFPEVRNIR